MDSEIKGGPKRYAHQTYALGVTYKEDRAKVRFHKKTWVPQWLWNLLGTPDPFDMLEAAMNRGTQQQRDALAESICAPLNEKLEEESKFAEAMGLKKTDYPGKL